MTVFEYQLAAAKTVKKLENKAYDVAHMDSGIMSEYGEVLDILKKAFAYDKEIDHEKLCLELGDISWYFVNRAVLFNLRLKEEYVFDKKEKILHTDKKRLYVFMDIIMRSMAEVYDFSSELFYDEKFKSCWRTYCGLVNQLGFTLEEVFEANIKKLQIRFKDLEFNAELAINKDAEQEQNQVYAKK